MFSCYNRLPDRYVSLLIPLSRLKPLLCKRFRKTSDLDTFGYIGEEMSQKIRIKSIPRAQGISDRVVAVALSGRFMDELLSGLPNVLMPLIRSQLGLSYTQVSLHGLTLDYVSAQSNSLVVS